MRTSKFTVEQIAHALRRAEGGVAVAEICRELGITETPFYRWKQKYHCLGNPEIRELRQPRDEQGKLKLAVADLMLDRTMLQDAMQIELLRPAAKRTLVAWGQDTYQVSQRHASGTYGVPRSSDCCQSSRPVQEPLRTRIRKISSIRVRYGHRRVHVLLHREALERERLAGSPAVPRRRTGATAREAEALPCDSGASGAARGQVAE